ncbi:MAG TPA: prefoldin subunit alpha [Candidatus Nanoarchaeia archaeon]|nr:prefoldin subunit alpha [Candidatus Nanoarchaeia archaeon]
MSTDEKWKDKYTQFQILQQNIQQLAEHHQLLQQQAAELEISKRAVLEIGKTKLNDSILAPVSNGIFIKAVLKDNKELIVNVGSNTTVTRTIPETAELLSTQQTEISQRIVEVENLLQQLQEQYLQLVQEIEGEPNIGLGNVPSEED